jgi:hypothetical protein
LKDALVRSRKKHNPASKSKCSFASSLGFKTQYSIDISILSKEENKIGHRSNKKLLQELGELLVKSRKIVLMTDKFPPTPPQIP